MESQYNHLLIKNKMPFKRMLELLITQLKVKHNSLSLNSNTYEFPGILCHGTLKMFQDQRERTFIHLCTGILHNFPLLKCVLYFFSSHLSYKI